MSGAARAGSARRWNNGEVVGADAANDARSDEIPDREPEAVAVLPQYPPAAMVRFAASNRPPRLKDGNTPPRFPYGRAHVVRQPLLAPAGLAFSGMGLLARLFPQPLPTDPHRAPVPSGGQTAFSDHFVDHCL